MPELYLAEPDSSLVCIGGEHDGQVVFVPSKWTTISLPRSKGLMEGYHVFLLFNGIRVLILDGMSVDDALRAALGFYTQRGIVAKSLKSIGHTEAACQVMVNQVRDFFRLIAQLQPGDKAALTIYAPAKAPSVRDELALIRHEAAPCRMPVFVDDVVFLNPQTAVDPPGSYAQMPDFCPDCHGTRTYQPLTGPAEPCQTCTVKP